MTIKPNVFLSSDDQSEKQIFKQKMNFFHFNYQAWPAHSHALLKKSAGG